tara:strand:- start:26 stop:364 length:339 start_codon:yes stop_codon:yes gene_type:complete
MEYKFRAWDNINKKMIFGPTDDNPNSSWILALPKSKHLTIMQFTGLLDKAGVEIWEGDLLKISMEGCEQDGYYLVSDLRSFHEALDTTDSYMRITEMEVASNKWANPELLEK